MKREIEALLFAADSPLTLVRLRKILPGSGTQEIKEAVAALEQDYEQNGEF